MTAIPVTITDEMLAGLHGADPTVLIKFDLWLDSGDRAGVPVISVDLITGATIVDLVYNTGVLKGVKATSGDLAGRQVTFTQVDPTKKPAWSTILLTLSGADATWIVSDEKPLIFELKSAGVNQLINGLESTIFSGVTGISPGQVSGGLVVDHADNRIEYEYTGAAIVVARTGYSGAGQVDTRWSTLRLNLYDPKDELTPAKIKATHYASVSAAQNATGGTPAHSVALGPVNQGSRFADIAFNTLYTGATQAVLIEAPILKYLLTYRSSASPAFSSIVVADDDYDVYYDPTRSYNTGGPRRGATLATFSQTGLATEFSLWRGMDNSTATDTPNSVELGQARFDLAWGVPDTDYTLGDYYRYLPHAVRNVDITVVDSPTLTALGNTKRGHFS